MLVERAGLIVGKRELIARVWHGANVGDGSLRVRLAELRHILKVENTSDRYIVNVPGQGYCFVAPVRQLLTPPPPPPATAPTLAAMRPLPGPDARVIGREEEMASTTDLLLRTRFVSLVGPGGIGKTILAEAIAHHVAAMLGCAIYFVDLSAIRDKTMLPGAMAAAFGLDDAQVKSIVAFLRSHRHLVILDGCEHVLDEAIPIAQSIFQQVDNALILTTSREALHLSGENVVRLQPLSVPPKGERLSAEAASRYSAIRLFVDRVVSRRHDFELAGEELEIAAEICRKLDGNPLAIALAAARVDTYGVQNVARLLEESFGFLVNDSRRGTSRHQSLSAVFDWSYNLLDQAHQQIIGHLAVFECAFTLQETLDALSQNAFDIVTQIINDLVDKSLLETSLASPLPSYRLLHMTRAYLLDKRGAIDDNLEI